MIEHSTIETPMKTSTPKKIIRCEECANDSECVDCIVERLEVKDEHN